VLTFVPAMAHPGSPRPRHATTLAVVCAAVLALVAGCDLGGREKAAFEDDGSGGGNPGGAAAECLRDADCVAAGPRCCDCPTHAVPATSPAQDACSDVGCAPMACGSPMQAACSSEYRCVLVCAPVACAGDISCPDGFAVDGNGCLTCQCAGGTSAGECTDDSDCVRVRDDCCGCENGGYDDAVPAGTADSHDRALMCPASPSCPGGNSCASDLAPRCVQGSCALVAGGLPLGACGRSDLPACAAGQACYVNANDQATMHGLGICQP
jgi:hypothetical protein